MDSENRAHDIENHRRVLQEFVKPNEDLPILSFKELNLVRGIVSNVPRKVIVPVERIIISSSLRSWADVNEYSSNVDLERFWETCESIKKYGFSENRAVHGLPIMTDYGGCFDVSEGQRRVMIAKAMGIEEIPVQLFDFYPTAMHLPGEGAFAMMNNRREQGLWKGNLNFDDTKGTGEAQVFDYEGIWVLAQNMDRVKEAYLKVGASGKSELPF